MESQVSPQFLHANSTSHTSVLSAIAELIDNAYDPDVSAKELHIDRLILGNSSNLKSCLVFTDDGCGVDVESMLKMLSFGYCEKVEKNGRKPIGHYGNGFKSGSMSLGDDVIVLSRKNNNLYAGLLSQTYLKAVKADRVIVPILSYRYSNNAYQLVQNKYSQKSVEAIVRFSPLKSANEIMKQFGEIPKSNGTRIIIFNLKTRSSSDIKNIDFETNQLDIMDSSYTIPDPNYKIEDAPLYKKSLREFCSILYLKPRMKIILRGKKVTTKLIARTLSKCENYTYKPQSLGKEVPIVYGLNEKSDQYGMMIYHRNRLIKAYEPVGVQKQANEFGMGVIGVIEVEQFLTPIHNKTDFIRDAKYLAALNAFGQKLNDYWQTIKHLNYMSTTSEKQQGSFWVQCDKCSKWRRLDVNFNEKQITEKWTCNLNPDLDYNNCDIDEEAFDDISQKPFRRAIRQTMRSIDRVITNAVKNPPQRNNLDMQSQRTLLAQRLEAKQNRIDYEKRFDLNYRLYGNNHPPPNLDDSQLSAALTNCENINSNDINNQLITDNDQIKHDSKYRAQLEITLRMLIELRANVQKFFKAYLPDRFEIPKKLVDIDKFLEELLTSNDVDANEENSIDYDKNIKEILETFQIDSNQTDIDTLRENFVQSNDQALTENKLVSGEDNNNDEWQNKTYPKDNIVMEKTNETIFESNDNAEKFQNN